MEVSQNLQISGTVYECCTRTPGIVARVYITYRRFTYGYEYRTKVAEVPGTVMDVVQNSQKFPGTGNTWLNTRLKGTKNNK